MVSTDKGLYGAPSGTTQGGGVLYNKKVYAELGLEVPTTWAEFKANNEKIKAAGKVDPIQQTYGDTWTSQLFVLGDFANVAAQDPDWAEQYTANKRKYVDEPALQSFENQQDAFDSGYFNKNFASATYDDGVKAVATGTAAHYPMLTSAVVGDQPELQGQLADVGLLRPAGAGCREHPDDDLAARARSTSRRRPRAPSSRRPRSSWPSSTRPRAATIQNDGNTVDRSVRRRACELPATCPDLVTDMQKYLDDGKSSPGAGVRLPDQGPEPREDHRRGRLRHQVRPRKAPRCTTRT